MIAKLDASYIKERPWKIYPRLLSYLLFEGRPVTTKGRWINPFVLLLFKFIKNLPLLKEVKSPIFIIGSGRSGTTILGRILSMHNHVGFLNEPKAIWYSICPKDDVIGSYSQDEASFRFIEKDAIQSRIKAAHKLYGAYLSLSCSKRVVDKYPELIFRIPYIKLIFPDAKFLFIVRNGSDTCYSIGRWSENHKVKKHKDNFDWWGVNNRKWKLINSQLVANSESLQDIAPRIAKFTDHVNMAMVEWIATMEEGICQMKNHMDSILMIKYEDLTKSPNEILQRILGFCQLPEDENMLHYANQKLSHAKTHPKLKIDPAIQPIVNSITRVLGYK